MSIFKRKQSNRKKAIKIINGKRGPIAIFKTQRENQDDFLSYAAERISPCERTIEELEEHIVKKFNAVPYKLSPNHLKSLKTNVILSKFDYLLSKPEKLKEDATEEEIRAYSDEVKNVFEQAKECSIDNLELEFKAYKLLGSKTVTNSNTEDEVVVEMELKSRYISMQNGDRNIFEDLIIYLGVSEKDINERNTNFIQYAHMLNNMGKL